MNGYFARLQTLGFSNAQACDLVATFMSSGDFERLNLYISEMEQEAYEQDAPSGKE